MRICLVYDCLYPYTVGGAERWYRALADELVGAGHEVTYLTRRQWADGHTPDIPGVEVIAVSPRDSLYTDDGRRRVTPPLRFGAGVFRHLVRNRRRYDAIHTGAFPYFALIAARLALAGRRLQIGVDWFEVWTWGYWRSYLGLAGGAIGWAVQRLCIALSPTSFVFSRLHGERLGGDPVVLSGLYDGDSETSPQAAEPREPLVLFAGRHIPEKRAELVPGAVAAARPEIPGLRGLILGDGPERERVLAAIDAAGAGEFVDAPGFVAWEEVEAAFERASCHLLPSIREGYGLVVIEAAAHGTPTVALAAPDNAAAELIEEGVNGFVAASPADVPRAIAAVHEGGTELRARTAAWFRDNAPRLSARASAHQIAAEYQAN